MKKYLLGILVLVLTVGVYSFTTKTSSHKQESLKWFQFIDIPGNDPDNPAHYQLSSNGGTEEPSCDGTTKVCARYAEPSASNPDIPNLDEVEETRMKD